MEYQKAVMRKTELLKMGFPETLLDRAMRSPGQTFAQKINPIKKCSPVIFDTDGFEKWRLEDIRTQQKANKMRMTVA